jgi:hypothetical protein
MITRSRIIMFGGTAVGLPRKYIVSTARKLIDSNDG